MIAIKIVSRLGAAESMKPSALYTYRGITAKQNPLTGDWLVDLEKAGPYYCDGKAEVRKLIDEYCRRVSTSAS